ncbi:MAG: LegC family aminotransferase [Methylovirgula sp.]
MIEPAAEAALAALEACLPARRPLALHEPLFAGNEWTYVKACLDTGWVSSVGAYVDRFEEMLSDMTGAHAVATVNGTAALHLALLLAGVQPGDEVIVPALTFVATANAVAYCHAIPHFAEVAEDTLGIDPMRLEAYLDKIGEFKAGTLYNCMTQRPIRAVIAMHCFGHPVDLDPLADTCRRHDLILVEDAAEALGSLYKGKHVGGTGRLATLSFNGNKTITTGGGGAVLTCDPDLAKRAKHLSTTARKAAGWNFEHDEIGYNYRMPNINAALGCAQIEALPQYLTAKRQLADLYRAAIGPLNLNGVRFIDEPPFARSNFWLNTLHFEADRARDQFLKIANERGLQCRPPWRLMPDLPIFANAPSMPLATARSLAATLANIPSGPGLLLSDP